MLCVGQNLRPEEGSRLAVLSAIKYHPEHKTENNTVSKNECHVFVCVCVLYLITKLKPKMAYSVNPYIHIRVYSSSPL